MAVQYRFLDGGQIYNGKVLKQGDRFYSTNGGAFEKGPNGSRELVVVNSNIQQSTVQDQVTPFIVGAQPRQSFYSSQFSNQTYFYSDGRVVPRGTRLHHHTIVPTGRQSNFMPQHTMDGNDVDVFLNNRSGIRRVNGGTRPVQTTRTNTRTTTQSNNTQRNTTPRTGGGMSGGGSRGGY